MSSLLQETQNLCRLYGLNPARNLGQNFLVNPRVYDEMIEAADLDKGDIVLEVGPGWGFLTERLAQAVRQVVAVEIDKKLADSLSLRLAAARLTDVRVINGDIMRWPDLPDLPATFKKSDYQIVANLPYQISAAFLRLFLTSDHQPRALTLLLQKEVAERLTARAGHMSVLAVSAQFYAEPRVIKTVPENDFWPTPKVMSAIIRLEVKKRPPLDHRESAAFFRLVKFGFVARRKMLKNNLAAAWHCQPKDAAERLAAAGLSASARAQDLGLEDWVRLFRQGF